MELIDYEHIFDETSESILRERLGIALIKPDAVELGIAEYIIDFLNYKMITLAEAELSGVFIISDLDYEIVRKIYPKSPEHKISTVFEQFRGHEGLIIIYKGYGHKQDLWKLLRELRGESLFYRTEVGIERGGIRGIIPVPSTGDNFRVIQNKLNRGEELTRDELRTYHANLMHTPENFDEFLGLASLIDWTKCE